MLTLVKKKTKGDDNESNPWWTRVVRGDPTIDLRYLAPEDRKMVDKMVEEAKSNQMERALQALRKRKATSESHSESG